MAFLCDVRLPTFSTSSSLLNVSLFWFNSLTCFWIASSLSNFPGTKRLLPRSCCYLSNKSSLSSLACESLTDNYLCESWLKEKCWFASRSTTKFSKPPFDCWLLRTMISLLSRLLYEFCWEYVTLFLTYCGELSICLCCWLPRRYIFFPLFACKFYASFSCRINSSRSMSFLWAYSLRWLKNLSCTQVKGTHVYIEFRMMRSSSSAAAPRSPATYDLSTYSIWHS